MKDKTTTEKQQRCNHCMKCFDDNLTECPYCGKDDALMELDEKNI